MLVVVSPAKSLDFESPLATPMYTMPRQLERSEALVGIMARKSPSDIATLMSISPTLAELNFERFQEWTVPFEPDNARQAVLAFDGDVYRGLDAAHRFDQGDFEYSQRVLRILSGLYGVLRPLDLIQPYRLEMGTKLKTDRGANLYQFWGEQLTDMLNDDMAGSPGEAVLINLASKEYFTAVDLDDLDAPVVSPKFLDSRDGGTFRIVSFYAKRARGEMAGWIVSDRITKVENLKAFTGMGYRYCADRSTATEPVFTRVNT
ncbi:MAG: peroxide stress protein YaaA [Acidimicrobiia bacterium]|nr:peroxide stress protein YaaA [Acidimicrobiia bacterium]